jgi:hypothetical protein
VSVANIRARAMRAAARLRERVANRPLDSSTWTDPQVEFLRDASPAKLFRKPNRAGGSHLLCADMIWRTQGNHPFRPDLHSDRKTKNWIATVTWPQSVPIQALVAQWVENDPDWLTPTWSAQKGYGDRSPVLVYKPTKSELGFKVSDGGTRGVRRLAGAQVDAVGIDEPTDIETYRELERRVSRTGGQISSYMTPINAVDDLTWLQELCDKGVVADHHHRMEPRLYTLTTAVVDGDRVELLAKPEVMAMPTGELLDEVWIEKQRAECLEQFADIVLDAAWPSAVGTLFADIWRPHVHVIDDDDLPDVDLTLALGIDHGSNDRSQVFVLLGVDESGVYPAVYVLDLVEMGDSSLPEEDAAAVLRMLDAWELEWSDLSYVFADHAHTPGASKNIVHKTNQDLELELVRQMKIRSLRRLRPRIGNVKRGRGITPKGSNLRGLIFIAHCMMRRGGFRVLRRCETLVRNIPRFRNLGPRDPMGHAIDALRYALTFWIRRNRAITAGGRVRMAAEEVEVDKAG